MNALFLTADLGGNIPPTVAVAEALITERRADLVVVDCMIPALIRGALSSGVPVALLFHTFGEFWMRSFDRGAIGRLFGLLGPRPGALWERAAARLLITDAELDPARHDPALARCTWTGTTEVGAEPLPHDDGNDGPPTPRSSIGRRGGGRPDHRDPRRRIAREPRSNSRSKAVSRPAKSARSCSSASPSSGSSDD